MLEDQAVISKDARTLLDKEVMASAKQQAKLLTKERFNATNIFAKRLNYSEITSLQRIKI